MSPPRKRKAAGKRSAGSRKFKEPGWTGWLLLGGLALAMTAGLAGWGDLFNETDSQYSAAARAMVEGRSSFLIPENNGVPRLNKPPLLVWMNAASFAVFGINEFAARFPSAMGIVAWVLMSAVFATQLVGPRVGILTGLMLLTSLGTFTLGRIIMPEPWFCAFLTAAFFCGWRACRPGADVAATNWLWGFWGCCALACFIKGWHGILLPLAVVGIFCATTKELRSFRRLLLFAPGWVVFFGINLPWLLYVEARFPGFLGHFFFAEGLGHVTGSDVPDTDYTNVPRIPFFLLHLVWFFPWILLAVPLSWNWRAWRALREVDPIVWIWTGVLLLVLLLLGQRQDYYGMIGWPLAALGMAVCWEKGFGKKMGWVLLGIGVLGTALALSFPVWAERVFPPQTAALADRATAVATLAGFDSGVWNSLRGIALVVFPAFAVAGFLSERFFRAGEADRAFGCWLVAAVVLCACAVAGVAKIAPWFSHAELARWILENRASTTGVIFEGGSDTGSSLYFYLGRDVYLTGDDAVPEFAARVFDVGAERYLSLDEAAGKLRGGGRLLLVTEHTEIPMWGIRASGLSEVAASGTQIVLEAER